MKLSDVVDWGTMNAALWRAARGKRSRRDVHAFLKAMPESLTRLAVEVSEERVQLGRMSQFPIWDPKPRTIHAPCFRERVLHHALMAHAGPVLDRKLVDDTFACRVGKGTLAAVVRAQVHMRRFDWYVKTDIASYFASINHTILHSLLARSFSDAGVLRLMDNIICAYETRKGVGLPIGALTSQHFANFYLGTLDRMLLADRRVRGMVRYMDDIVWWMDRRQDAINTLEKAEALVQEQLALQMKPGTVIRRSARGLVFCGFLVYPGTIRLSKRRRYRYRDIRRRWEKAYEAGRIDGKGLQAGYAAAHAIVCFADSAGWRAEHLRRSPTIDA
jgi:hypothetical protein